MTTHCVPPKCAEVSDRCQCPNSWIEYLAHAAAERRKAGLPRVSLRHHATEYKKVANNLRLTRSVGPCKKINTSLLCGWRSSRRRDSSNTQSRDTWSLDLLRLKYKGIHYIKGEPCVRTVEYHGKPLVIKDYKITNELDRRDFLYQTLIHRKLCKTIPNKVPKLYKAYFLKTPGSTHGVHIMQRLEGVLLKTVVPLFTTWPPGKMQQLAWGLKDLFESLDKSHCSHGDLHDRNIILDIDSSGNIENVQAIDFGNSDIAQSKPNMNFMGFLYFICSISDDTRLLALIPYFRATGLSIPDNILEWSDRDFEKHTVCGTLPKSDPKVCLDDTITDYDL